MAGSQDATEPNDNDTNEKWRVLWCKLLKRFEEESGDQPSEEDLDGWELALLARLLGEELATVLPSSWSAVCRKAAAGAKRSLLRLAAGPAGAKLGLCQSLLRKSVEKLWAGVYAEQCLEEAAGHERHGDLLAAEANYLRALHMGVAQPLEVGLARLACLLCQEGYENAAIPLLARGGWRYRLAQWVLQYPVDPTNLQKAPLDVRMSNEGATSAAPAYALDAALPSFILAHLRSVFAPGAKFWKEHGYNEVLGQGESGYFSYLHPLGSSPNWPTSTLDVIIARIQALAKNFFPEVAEAGFAEWWAHCRPHACGHQLHFDSDNEGIGGARHPICTAVIYVDAPTGVGGPTLVTDQRLCDEALASKAWLIYPRPGRVALVDGSVLHGVVPGHGKAYPGSIGLRRITWMVAFWKTIRMRPFGPDGMAGSSRPLPDPSKEFQAGGRFYSWHRALLPLLLPECAEAGHSVEPLPIPVVSPLPSRPNVWVRLGADGREVDAQVDDSEGVHGEAVLPGYGECFQF